VTEGNGNAPERTHHHRHRSRHTIPRLLMAAGIGIAVIGLGLLCWSCAISSADNASPAVLAAQDRIAPEMLAQFRFTPWQAPESDVQPFISAERRFDKRKIVRYRRGTRYHWLVHYTYYEAEYERPDGARVVGPAVGPQAYTTPNFLIHVPLALAGALLFVGGLLGRIGRAWPASEPQVLGMIRDA